MPLLMGCSGFTNWFHARDNMNNGVRAFRETNYPAAVEYFEAALGYDPEVPNGELYLGLSYSQQFIAGLETPENDRIARLAIETLDGVLVKEPLNSTAIAALASLYQESGDLERARDYYLLQTQASPDDPVGFYSVGSINWYIVNAPFIEKTDEESMALIQESQEYLDRALDMDPTYVDAAVYKNLQYRQEAALISVDTEDEAEIARRDELEALADEWYERALAMREENAARAAQGALAVE
jgi:tetratricopeptide (TPR) repeat protein